MNQKEELAIAVSQLRSGNFPEAIRHCDKSLAKYPGDAKFLCLAGQASIGLKKFDSAEKYINEAIRVSPDFATGFETHGDLMLVKGLVSKARGSILPMYSGKWINSTTPLKVPGRCCG